VPYQNRVTPGGDLIAVADRGTLTGNRGVLHDSNGRTVRRSQVRRWITCALTFRDRHQVVMAPNRFTHLFFLDEVTSLAAGHRPCAQCRNADYRRFQRCWASAHGLAEPPAADAMDAVLGIERALVGGRRRTHPCAATNLPQGAFVRWQDAEWLVTDGTLLRWTPGGYTERRPPPSGMLATLTPPTLVAVLRAGFGPGVHVSAAVT
jgi:hypothetical protein